MEAQNQASGGPGYGTVARVPAGRYRAAPERIRVARLVFAGLSWAALVGMGLLVEFGPNEEPSTVLTMIAGALVANMTHAMRFLYGSDTEATRSNR